MNFILTTSRCTLVVSYNFFLFCYSCITFTDCDVSPRFYTRYRRTTVTAGVTLFLTFRKTLDANFFFTDQYRRKNVKYLPIIFKESKI